MKELSTIFYMKELSTIFYMKELSTIFYSKFLNWVLEHSQQTVNFLKNVSMILNVLLKGSVLKLFDLLFHSCFDNYNNLGKIIWFTALFPYFVMFILLFRALTLDGRFYGGKRLFQYNEDDFRF